MSCSVSWGCITWCTAASEPQKLLDRASDCLGARKMTRNFVLHLGSSAPYMSHDKARHQWRVKTHEHLPHQAVSMSAWSSLDLFSGARLCDNPHFICRTKWQKVFCLGCHSYYSQKHSNSASWQNEWEACMHFARPALCMQQTSNTVAL